MKTVKPGTWRTRDGNELGGRRGRGGLSKETHGGRVLCVSTVYLLQEASIPFTGDLTPGQQCQHSGLQLGACLWTAPPNTHTHSLGSAAGVPTEASPHTTLT